MRLNPFDAVWLMLESPDTPMHVGTLAIFRKPRAAADDFLGSLAAALCSDEPVEPWNLRLADETTSALLPRLVPDHGFDIDYHFRHTALPQPGGERELGVVVSRLHSQALDRNRPLWELHLIEGLENDRFALYVKIHHALVANVNAIPMLLESLAASARSKQLKPLWTQPLNLSDNLISDIDSGEVVKSLTDSLETFGAMGRVASGIVRDALRGKGERSFLLPRGTPRSTLNRRINSQRRFATQQFTHERIAQLGKATDCTVNTILAYLCGSSLRRFFKEYNALPDQPLIAALPISLQERSSSLPGNAIMGLRVALGTDIGDPLRRLAAVKESMQTVREDRATLPDAAALPYVMLRSSPVYASQVPGLGRWVPPLFNLSVSNTPGTEKPKYLNGARLEAIYPMNPLLQYSALSIDCVSYAGTLNVGFTGARDTLPHLQRLAVYAGNAVDELETILAERKSA